MFDSVALFIFLKYFLLACVSWHVQAMIFQNAILRPLLPLLMSRMTARCLEDFHCRGLEMHSRTGYPSLPREQDLM